MIVTKRNGQTEEMKFDKVTKRISQMCVGLSDTIDPQKLAMSVIEGLYDGVSTSEIDIQIAEISASKVVVHPDYSQLASNVSVSNLHKNTKSTFSTLVKDLYDYVNPENGKHSPIVSKELLDLVKKNSAKINAYIDYSRDFSYDYFGLRTLMKSYLLKIDGVIAERPQQMLMRVSLGIHKDNLDMAFKTYDMMSKKYYTHATPTLFNSGTPRPQMSSCFLIDMKDDSIDGIFDTLKICAKISKDAGGIGLTSHKVRSKGSYIAGTNGVSNGIVPMLKVFNETARYVDQGGNKRKGSFAIYLEPWHSDIMDFLDLKKNHGKEEMRARDLFYAMWQNDLFMERVKNGEMWSLMSPSDCKGLEEVYGDEFKTLYEKYEAKGNYIEQIEARKLWEKILESQIETGTPYIVYKDASNKKSNQKNLGTIKSSNLCSEIIEYTSPDEVAVCNLASIALPSFLVKDDNGNYKFDHKALYDVAHHATYSLNKVIDVNYYPVEEAKTSNMKHRPIGLGIQGLADVFMKLRIPFTSDRAKKLNKDIQETIYFAAMKCSNEIAKVDGAYETFMGSPLSKGIFQFDMWDIKTSDLSGRWDWEQLRNDVVDYGVRNSLLTALMPTASTGQILGNNECFEPYTSNLSTRRVLSGEFIVVNKHLISHLIELGLWDNDMKKFLMFENGSVQNLPIPQEIKEIYKTAYEMSMKDIIDMSADRGAFVDQSQSMNLFMKGATTKKLNAMHFYGWKKGLKTGMYYLRTKSAKNAVQVTLGVDTEDLLKKANEDFNNKVSKEVQAEFEDNKPMSAEEFKAMIAQGRNASENDDEDCLMCGS